jgi:hypothetical protein
MSYVKVGGGKSIVLDSFLHYNTLGTYISQLWTTQEPAAGVMLLAENYPPDASSLAHELRRLVDGGMLIVVPRAYGASSLSLFEPQTVIAASHITQSETAPSTSHARSSNFVCDSALVRVKCVGHIIDHERAHDDGSVNIVAENILLDGGVVVSDTGSGELAAEIYVYTLTRQKQ